MIWPYIHGLINFLEKQQSCIFRFPEERDKRVFTVFHKMTIIQLHNDIVMEDHIPVTQMTLECEQVFVKALDGFLLQDVVNAIPSIQQAHFYMRLLFLLRLWTLNHLTLLCKQTLRFSLRWSVHSKLMTLKGYALWVTHLPLPAFPLVPWSDWQPWRAVRAVEQKRCEHEQTHSESAKQSSESWWSRALSQSPSWINSLLILDARHKKINVVNKKINAFY